MPPFHWINLLVLLAVLLVVGAVLSAGAVWLMAAVLLRPPRMTDGKAVWVLKRLSPGDLALHFQAERFVVQDFSADRHPGGFARAPGGGRLALAGWWIANPRAAGRCVVLLHGYADAKVGAIAWAPLLHELGYNVLAIDLRAHGESGGRFCTGGYFERHDVSQVIDELRQSRPADAKRIALFGVSLGAAVAVATAEVRAERGDPEDLSAVVMESPFADYRRAVTAHGRRLAMPGGFFPRLTLWAAERMSGADFGAVRPADLIARVRCPLLVIQGGRDSFSRGEDGEAIRRALSDRPAGSGTAEYWLADDAEHALIFPRHAGEYRRRVGAFLAAAFGRETPADPTAIDAAAETTRRV